MELSEEHCQVESYIIRNVDIQFMIKIYNLLPLPLVVLKYKKPDNLLNRWISKAQHTIWGHLVVKERHVLFKVEGHRDPWCLLEPMTTIF